MENAIETIERGGFTARIYYDTDTLNPRKDWDNLGKIVSRKLTSDEEFEFSGDKEDDCKRLKKEFGAAVILPIYMYSHGGETINTTGFSCPWDSGQVGWIFATTEDICKEYNCKQVNPAIRRRVEQILVGEIETYDQYIRGEVYGYELFDKTGNEIDSCWGFYGFDYIKEEVNSLIAWHIRQVEEDEKEQFALFVNAGLPIPAKDEKTA